MIQNKSVIRLGCLQNTDYSLAGVTKESLEEETRSSFFEMLLPDMHSFEQISDALKEGKIEGAFIPLPCAMDLYGSGLEIKLLFFANRGGGSITKNKDAGIKRIQDFKGKTILTPAFLSVQNMLLHKMLLSSGLRLGYSRDIENDVFLQVVPSNIIPEVVENDSDNDIGGFVVQEPFGTDAIKSKNYVELCKFNSLWADHPDNVFVLRESVVKDNPTETKDIVKAMIESGQKIDQKEIFSLSRFIPDSSVVEVVQDYMVEHTDFMSEKIDIENFIDTSFIDNIKEN